MREIGESYENAVKPHAHVNDVMIPLYSTVNGKVIHDPNHLNAAYWRQNLESPVLFFSSIEAILRRPDENQVFLEIGPHSALSGPIRQIIQNSGNTSSIYVPTLVREVNQMNCVFTTLGNMWSNGATVDLTSIIKSGNVLTGLPTYPWDHKAKHWNESKIAQTWRLRQFPHHELLGSRLPGSSDQEPTWRNVLCLEDVPWLLEHVLFNDIIFPGAGYIAMAGEAIYQTTGTPEFSTKNILFKAPLFLVEGQTIELITTLKPVRD
jgi:acyl transferase domain-containing protein